MTEPAVTAAVSRARPRPTVLPWEQQPGENDLWFGRFLRYVALGPTRSVSLVSTGERNHYPVPAHWPMVAKQRNWRERARAFDEAARKDEAMVQRINDMINLMASVSPPVESMKLTKSQYVLPPPGDEDESVDSIAD